MQAHVLPVQVSYLTASSVPPTPLAPAVSQATTIMPAAVVSLAPTDVFNATTPRSVTNAVTVSTSLLPSLAPSAPLP